MIRKSTTTRKQEWEGKQLYGYFKQRNWQNLTQKDVEMVIKGKFKWENKSLLNVAQKRAINRKYVIAKIHKRPEFRKFRLRGDRGETIDYIINKCSKQSQKDYKTKHDWVAKVIQ